MRNLKLPILFAARYLLSKKSINAINIISSISIVGVFVSTAALVIVLSFYNGMEKFILSMYSNYSPELRIEAKEGKSFNPNISVFNALEDNSSVEYLSPVIEEKILSQYNGQQFVVKLKGVNPNTLQKEKYLNIIHSGDNFLEKDSLPFALIGAQVQANLKVPINQGYNNAVDLYFPKKNISLNNINPLEDFNIRSILVNGMLTYEPDFDNLMLVPISFARDILEMDSTISALEVFLPNTTDVYSMQRKLQKELGDTFSVKNREEQNPTLYKTIKSEKWIVFFILTFIGIIAIFNIIGSLTMLVIDKKDDMKVLQNLGAKKSTVENIFFLEGILISMIGSVIGIIIGYIFTSLQDTYGFIKTGNLEGSFLDVYPVDIRWQDFCLVFFTVILLSTLVSYIASKLSVREIG